LRELKQLGFIRNVPRLAVIQAEAPHRFMSCIATVSAASLNPSTSGNPGDGNQDWRSGFLAEGAP